MRKVPHTIISKDCKHRLFWEKDNITEITLSEKLAYILNKSGDKKVKGTFQSTCADKFQHRSTTTN